MIFSGYSGQREHLGAWQDLMGRHAAWLGLHPSFQSFTLTGGKSFAACWLGTRPGTGLAGGAALGEEWADCLVIRSSEPTVEPLPGATLDDLRRRLTASLERNVVQVALSLRSGELSVIVPPTTPEQLYHASDGRGFVFANDMRLLMRWAGMELDERAVFALLRYAAIPPPLTITRRVKRVPGGHLLKLAPGSADPVVEVFFQPGREPDKNVRNGNSLSPRAAVEGTLDKLLADVPAPAALFFSGGVDSSLLAARLALLGRRDVTLINYAFGAGDPEGQHALRVAKHLGLRCEQILYEPESVSLLLERLGKDYSLPFGDISVIPTNLLVHAAQPLIEARATIIEGTGADGAFGRWLPRSRWSSVPAPVKWLLAEVYEKLQIWRSNSEVDRLFRQARRRAQMPLKHAVVVARNCLHGIAYSIPAPIQEELAETIRTRMEILSAALEPEEQYSLLDLVHVCAGLFAEKSYDPLRRLGVAAVYPFLEPPMVRLALRLAYEDKCQGGEGKALLKNLLLASLPRDLIYRPKSGFRPPFADVLTYAEVRRFVRDAVMAPGSRLLDFCHRRTVQKMFERAERGRPLSGEAHKLLWTLIFVTAWLREQES